MAILALDSSTNTAAFAICDSGKIVSENFLNAGLTHSQTLMPMVQSAMELVPNLEIEKIAVTVGPGSFTGVRIAVAAAKGLAFCKNLPCVPVSSLEALAYNCRNLKGEYTICSMFDARLKRVYNALFLLKDGVITRLTDDNCEEIEVLAQNLSQIDNLIIIGDGVKAFINIKPQFEENANYEEFNYIKASAIVAASLNKQEIDGAKLAPVYLQLPQAERERLEKLKNLEENK